MATNVRRRGWRYHGEASTPYLSAYSGNLEAIRLTPSTTGVDVRLLGDTPGTYYIDFDASGPTLTLAGVSLAVTGLAKIDIGLTGTPLVLTAGTPIFEMYSTCASVSASTSAESFLVSNVMTGPAGVGGRARFYMTTSVALGGWSNALKADVLYGTAGSTTGLGSAFCAEMTLSAGTTSGTYAPLESELTANSAVSSGTATSFLYMNIGGTNSTGKTTLNTNGYLFELGAGVVDTSSGMFDVATTTPTTVEFDAQLRIRVGGVDYFIPLSADTSFE